jgi:hypothetical protein
MSNEAAGAWFTVEGSGNWTLNEQTEQATIFNDRELFQFHVGWLEAMFCKGDANG